MQYDAILFDLDGTLADTVDDIAAAGNHMLTALGRPARPRDDYKYLAGQGAEWLVREALRGADEDEIQRGLALFSGHYAEHNHALTQPYDGIEAMLDALRDAGVHLAVLSNKPDALARDVVARLLANWSFDAVAGAKPDVPLKPDAGAATEIARSLEVPVDRWAYLGDTKVDMATATNAGMFAIGCTWGFRDEAELRQAGADAIVHHPREVVELILNGG